MDAGAIEKIQRNVAHSDAIHQFGETLQAQPVVLVPDGFKIECVENHMPAPTHFRGQFATSHIESFVAYVGTHKQDDTAVFVAPESMRANAHITLGTNDKPKHRTHQAALTLEKTQPYSALRGALSDSARHTQEGFAFWLQDWADFITCLDVNAEKEIDLKDAMKAVRQIKVDESTSTDNRISHYAAERSTLEKIASLAGYLQFTCHPYKELSERAFLLRLQVARCEKNVLITLRIVGFEQQLEEMAEEFETVLNQKMLHLDLPVYIGSFK